MRPDALLLCYPVITSGRFAHRGSFDNLLGDGKDDASLLELLSIEKHVDATMPPVFIWHTITDQAVPVENSLLMIQACRDAGVSIEAHLFPQGGHGLSLAVDTARAGSPGEGDLNNVVPAVQIWPRLAFDWLRRTFDVR